MSARHVSSLANRSKNGRVCVTYTLRRDGTMVTRRDLILESLARQWRRAFTPLQKVLVPVSLGAALVALFLLSLGPPLSYYRAILPVVDSARRADGLVRGEFILLRLLGFVSAFCALIFCMVLAWCLSAPAPASLICAGGVVLLLLLLRSSLEMDKAR